MSLSDAAGIRLSRFGYLMGLYAENYQRLQRVFGVDTLEGEHLRSSIDDGLDLRLEVIERHPYTLELKLTYDLLDPVTGEPDPSAFLRVYRDARMAEVTHCYVGRRWQDALGLDAPARTVVGHRLRMNTFLSKWLEYLADQGHSRFTLRPATGPLRREHCVGA
jgi:uncharacterized protein